MLCQIYYRNNIAIIILSSYCYYCVILFHPPMQKILHIGVGIMLIKTPSLTQLIFANSYILFISFFESIFSITIEPIK